MKSIEIIKELSILTKSSKGYEQLEIISNYITRLLDNKEKQEALARLATFRLGESEAGDYAGQDWEIICYISKLYRLSGAPIEMYNFMDLWQNNALVEEFAMYLESNFHRSSSIDDEIQLERWSFEAYEQHKHMRKN